MTALDFSGLASELLSRSESICRDWFPNGKRRGHEYVTGNLNGEPGESLSINLNTGVWSDFAAGIAGGDLIALYAAIHNIEQGEAYKRLSNGHAPVAMARPAKQEPTIVIPAPDGAAVPNMRHPQYGKPSASWVYRDQRGAVLGYVARYDTDGRKQIVPWSYAEGRGWVMKSLPAPRPLYGLDRLKLNQRVLLVEGEKAADAAQAIVGDRYAVLTWSGGAQAHAKADLSPLAGHRILLWPDADAPGIKAMQAVSDRLLPVCPEIKIIDVDGMPDGWDAADSRFTWAEFLAWARPRGKLILQETVSHNGTSSSPAPLSMGDAAASGTVPASPAGAASVPCFGTWDALGLALTDKGAPIMNLDNVVRAIEADPTLKGRIWYDEFLDAIVTNWQGPERKWKDADDVLLQLYMQRHVGLNRVGTQTCHDAALVAAFHDTRNECKSWITSHTWDGVDRLAFMMSEGFGAADNDYTRAVGRCWIMSIVARVMQPGCKVDTVPVLEGVQGTQKSTALSVLGGKWFVECHESIMSKDFYGVLQGHMLVEIAEMHSFTRAEIERIKGIISCRVDRFRKAYGRHTEDHPRHTVLVGTTNRDDWQKDDTGARRFWPIACGEISLDWLTYNRDQLFAEALHLYRHGGKWWDVPADMQREEVEARRDVDSWEILIEDWLADPFADRRRVFIHEILSDCLKLEVGRHDQLVQKRVGRIMRALGYNNRPLRCDDGKLRKTWVRNEYGG